MRMSDTATTPCRLVDAAEVLFAAHGIEGVSLREINRAAGARNASALQYHFGGRDGLLRAVLAKHHHAVEARRHAMLDACEADGDADLRALAGALVRPSAAMLADGDGGPAYLQIMADLMNRPRPVIDPAALDDPASSIYRWRTLVAGLLDNDATRLHRRFVAMRFAAVELARRARSAPHTDDRLFVSHLVDLVAGVLAAPLSDETRRLDAERARAVDADPTSVPTYAPVEADAPWPSTSR
jgi:AcrR family transcriptional regulator